MNLGLIIFALVQFSNLNSSILGFPYKNFKSNGVREEKFDNGNYLVEWEVDTKNAEIYFSVSVNTTGFVGFGISPKPMMTGADIFIAGVFPNGSNYYGDYHGIGNQKPVLDTKSQDWNVFAMYELKGTTNIYFSRKLETCDPEDVLITTDTLNIIWSYGKTDNIEYHGVHRGAASSNMLDPPSPPLDTSAFSTWTIPRKMIMPPDDTTYWCTFHKQPIFTQDQHIVGFSINLPSAESLKHSHHATLYQCATPEGVDAETIFEPYLNHPGGHCYGLDNSIPNNYCQKNFYNWAIGGKVTTFPDDVGYRVRGGVETKSEYYMFEVHYDNPDELHGVEVETAVEIYHTSKLRKYEAELLIVSHILSPTHIIPPKAPEFTTAGHCSPECTKERLPEEGINIFNILLHSHLAGRKLTLRHFRDGKELPWIANDHRYDFNYQQSRPLRNMAKILPGDQVTFECVTDTSDRNTVTLSGLSTRHEMCDAFVWYYPKQNFARCHSMYDNYNFLFKKFGIKNFTIINDSYDPTVTEPPEHAGKLFSEVLNEFPWTGKDRIEMQQELRFSEHLCECFGSDDFNNGGGSKYFRVNYPKVEEPYQPPTQC